MQVTKVCRNLLTWMVAIHLAARWSDSHRVCSQMHLHRRFDFESFGLIFSWYNFERTDFRINDRLWQFWNLQGGFLAASSNVFSMPSRKMRQSLMPNATSDQNFRNAPRLATSPSIVLRYQRVLKEIFTKFFSLLNHVLWRREMKNSIPEHHGSQEQWWSLQQHNF